MVEKPHLVADRQKVADAESIRWGDENEAPWENAVRDMTRVSIRDSGVLSPRPTVATLIASDNKNIYDTADGSNFASFSGGADAIALSDEYFASGSGSGCQVYDLQTRSQVYSRNETGGDVTGVALSDDYFAYVYLSSNDIYVHSLEDGALAQTISNENISGVLDVEFSDSHLAVVDDEQVVHIFDTSDWSYVVTLSEASGNSDIIDIDMTSEYVAYSLDDCHVYRTSDWSLAYTFNETQSVVTSVSLNGSHVLYVGGAFQYTGHIHDLSDGSLVNSYSSDNMLEFGKLLDSKVIFGHTHDAMSGEENRGCTILNRSDGSVIRSVDTGGGAWDYIG